MHFRTKSSLTDDARGVDIVDQSQAKVENFNLCGELVVPARNTDIL